MLTPASSGLVPRARLVSTLLEEVERRNVFLVPLDDERRWCRYHHLFRDALRNHLLQSQEEVVSRLHLRASEWYANHDMTVGCYLLQRARTRPHRFLSTQGPDIPARSLRC